MRSPGYVGRWVIGAEELAALRRAPPRSAAAVLGRGAGRASPRSAAVRGTLCAVLRRTWPRSAVSIFLLQQCWAEELAALRRAPPRSEGLTVPYFAALSRAQP